MNQHTVDTPMQAPPDTSPVVGVTRMTHHACPSCRRTEGFVYIGSQVWPEAVARRLNCDPVVSLWRCEACLTTVSSMELK